MRLKSSFKQLALVIALLLSAASFSFGWSAPTATPPGNNTVAPINDSTTPQSKGGTTVPAGSLLDINGTTSVNRFYTWNDATISSNLTIQNLPASQNGWTSGLKSVCVDNNHKLIICPTQGPVCGNGVVESPDEDCDDGNTVNGDGCTAACMIEVGGGGGGFGGSFATCFIKDTKVRMADNTEKNIQDVQIGDVLKGETSDNTVLAFHRPTLQGKVYGFNGGRLFVTEEHPFKTTEGWKSINPEKTKEENIGITVTPLRVGDTLITEKGFMQIHSIESGAMPKTTPLYNFILSGDRTYYADGYLVHNKQACTGDGNPSCGTTLFCLNADDAPGGGHAIPPGQSQGGTCALPCGEPTPDPATYCSNLAPAGEQNPTKRFCASDGYVHKCY
jgi:cysteine-rich repeat protein